MLDLDQNPNFHYHSKCKRMKLTHFCFADDLTAICRGDKTSLLILQKKIEDFAKVSGLIVNPAKSQVFFGFEAQCHKQYILEKLQYSEGKLPVRYLGIPIISTRLSAADFSHIIENIRARLGSWSGRFLSYASRLQLINSDIYFIYNPIGLLC